jgi:hypothetical protein
MFEKVLCKLLANRVICHSPKWVSCDGIDLAIGDVFAILGPQSFFGTRFTLVHYMLSGANESRLPLLKR